MPHRLTRAKTLQNAAFLRALGRTANVRRAAAEVEVGTSVLYARRRAHPRFAQAWDAVMATAQARLRSKGAGSAAPGGDGAHRTAGGEPVIVRGAGGRMQVRRAHPNRLTRACEQAFLAALSATANVTLSAAAAGGTRNAFLLRRRTNPAFAREMRMALQIGYERIEMALLEGWSAGSREDDSWRHNDLPPIPPMTPSQGLQLLYLHQKAALMLDEPPHLKRRRGESPDAYSFRLSAMGEAQLERDREAYDVAEAARQADREAPSPHEPPPPALPDLAQVTGWSRADPTKTPHHPERALFGGWRLGDWEGKGER